jgi:glycosyltransferase involved in cell wall biosynthesis
MRRYVLLATGCLNRNASFVRLRELGLALARRSVDVHFIIDDTDYNASLVPNLSPTTVHLVAGSLRPLRLIRRRRLLKRLKPNAVHILNPQPLNTSSVALSSVPLVCDWDELLSVRARPWWRGPSDLLSESYGRGRACLNVVASHYLQDMLHHRYGLSALYLPYAPYLPDITPSQNPFTRPTAVYVGNLVRDYDHDIIIDAWEILARRGIAIDLVICGGGQLLEDVREDVARRGLDRVHIEGYVTGQPLSDRMLHAHVLLLPIRDNPGNRARCPSKTFAYIQARRPVIANAVGEVVEALGKSATYVPASPEGFAAAVEATVGKELPDVSYPRLQTWQDLGDKLIESLEACRVFR